MADSIVVRSAQFVDPGEMPLVHQDDRRIITERVTPADGNIDRLTRIEVTGVEVSLGNHHHDFDEAFTGRGGGTLYTAPADDPTSITSHDLPEAGWQVTVLASTVHMFVLSKGAVLVSRTDRHFVSEANRHEHPDQPVNTHVLRLVV